MKILPLLFLAFICSCGPSAESQNSTPKNVKAGNLQFFETYKWSEINDSWKAACKWVNDHDTLALQGKRSMDELNHTGLDRMVFGMYDNSVMYANAEDVSTIQSLLQTPEIKNNFPKDLEFMWSFSPEDSPKSKKMYALYAVKVPPGNKARIDGRHLEKVETGVSKYSQGPIISITMNDQGAHDWEIMTRKNIGRPIAITMDHQVLSCPVVNGAIAGGATEISGNFSVKEAEELAARINAGR